MSHRSRSLIGLLSALAVSAPAFGATPENDYALDQNWLCRPGRADTCATPTTATVIAADGSHRTVTHAVAADPPIDCFYVYPTVSREPSLNSDMASTGAEEATVVAQFAPFASQCRTFAPRYRQVTIAGLRSAFTGGPSPDDALAYGDVLDAWHHYLANDNHGRGFVLVGHSQGSEILKRLVADEIDGKPLQARFVSAVIPGTLVETQQRAGAGGTYAHVAPCAQATDTSCVIAYSTYLQSGTPVERPVFGVETTDGRVASCVDPARLTGSATLAVEFPAVLSPAADVDTTFIELPGVVKSTCMTQGAQTFLAISTADDPRAARVEQGLAALQARRPSWGLHRLDMNLALGDLLTIVETQARAWAARK